MVIQRTANNRIMPKIIVKTDITSYSAGVSGISLSVWDGQYNFSVNIDKDEVKKIVEMANKYQLV